MIYTNSYISNRTSKSCIPGWVLHSEKHFSLVCMFSLHVHFVNIYHSSLFENICSHAQFICGYRLSDGANTFLDCKGQGRYAASNARSQMMKNVVRLSLNLITLCLFMCSKTSCHLGLSLGCFYLQAVLPLSPAATHHVCPLLSGKWFAITTISLRCILDLV